MCTCILGPIQRHIIKRNYHSQERLRCHALGPNLTRQLTQKTTWLSSTLRLDQDFCNRLYSEEVLTHAEIEETQVHLTVVTSTAISYTSTHPPDFLKGIRCEVLFLMDRLSSYFTVQGNGSWHLVIIYHKRIVQ